MPEAQLPRIAEPVEKVGGRAVEGLKSGSDISKMVLFGLKRGSKADARRFFNSLSCSRQLGEQR
jgi:hypothetical protein